MNKIFPKVTIITPSFNQAQFLERTILSVIQQDYPNLEYIIIDGGSTDGSVDIIKKYEKHISYWVSEKDNGIYDAMNKGIALATGDVVGILNSDDFYIDENVIEKVVKVFQEKEADSIFADLVFVKPNNLEKNIRYYDSSKFKPSKFAYGWMPAHPTFFVKREIYEKYGVFQLDYKIAADYEILVRFLEKYKISYFKSKEHVEYDTWLHAIKTIGSSIIAQMVLKVIIF